MTLNEAAGAADPVDADLGPDVVITGANMDGTTRAHTAYNGDADYPPDWDDVAGWDNEAEEAECHSDAAMGITPEERAEMGAEDDAPLLELDGGTAEKPKKTRKKVAPKPKKVKAPKPPKPDKYADMPEWFDTPTQQVGKRLWLRGTGATPARFMFVAESPAPEAIVARMAFADTNGRKTRAMLVKAGFDMTAGDTYSTYAIKYALHKKPGAGDVSSCRKMLMEEIERVNPDVIVCLGSKATEAVTGGYLTFTNIRGDFVHIPTINRWVLATNYPLHAVRITEFESVILQDFKRLAEYQRTGVRPTAPDIHITLLHTAADVAAFRETLFEVMPAPILSIDMEWDGFHWMDPARYIRTLQIGYMPRMCATVEFTYEGGEPVDIPEGAPSGDIWGEVKLLLEDPRVGIIGHNVIADGQWLAANGVDIRERVVFDTMLAEALLNEAGPFGLDELAIKYTEFGRYAVPLEEWKGANPKMHASGYGHIPREILMPYGAIDVDAPRDIAAAQVPLLIADGIMDPRTSIDANGNTITFPSLWQTTLDTQRIIYELESTGLCVDRVRLKELTTAYQDKKADVMGVLATAVSQLGIPEFNPGSPQQVSKLLFDILKLTPVTTTDGQAWGETVGNMGMDDPEDANASTNGTTLEILQDAHPIVSQLLQYRRLDTPCKNWLRDLEDGDNFNTGKGLLAKLWPDGKLHSRFSQLAETGRFRVSAPNSQNWPKRAEGSMEAIFGKDNIPPMIRTIIVPPTGFVMIEGDFVQAELFALAGLSGDENMIGALTTPGKDLHDLTAITAFNLTILDPAGNETTMDESVRIAAQVGADSKEFKDWQSHLSYVDQRGHRMDRSTFKHTIRVSAKNINFGT